jgi:hypothetical protein
LVVPLVGVVPHFPGMQFGLVAVVPMLNAETEVEPKAVKSSAAAIILMIFCMGFRSLFSIVWGIDLPRVLHFPNRESFCSVRLRFQKLKKTRALLPGSASGRGHQNA